jgi:hypothetical protein
MADPPSKAIPLTADKIPRLAAWDAHPEASVLHISFVEGPLAVVTVSSDCTIQTWFLGGSPLGCFVSTTALALSNPEEVASVQIGVDFSPSQPQEPLCTIGKSLEKSRTRNGLSTTFRFVTESDGLAADTVSAGESDSEDINERHGEVLELSLNERWLHRYNDLVAPYGVVHVTNRRMTTNLMTALHRQSYTKGQCEEEAAGEGDDVNVHELTAPDGRRSKVSPLPKIETAPVESMRSKTTVKVTRATHDRPTRPEINDVSVHNPIDVETSKQVKTQGSSLMVDAPLAQLVNSSLEDFMKFQHTALLNVNRAQRSGSLSVMTGVKTHEVPDGKRCHKRLSPIPGKCASELMDSTSTLTLSPESRLLRPIVKSSALRKTLPIEAVTKEAPRGNLDFAMGPACQVIEARKLIGCRAQEGSEDESQTAFRRLRLFCDNTVPLIKMRRPRESDCMLF